MSLIFLLRGNNFIKGKKALEGMLIIIYNGKFVNFLLVSLYITWP